MSGRTPSTVTIALAAAASLVLGACSRLEQAGASRYSPPEGYAAPDAVVAQYAPANTDRIAEPAAPKRLVVTHAFALRLRNDEIEAVQQRHLAECVRLGCTVASTQLDRLNESRVNARASVRIAPEAYPEFAMVLASAPAQIVSHVETTDDKTVPFLDVEKRLEVKTTLRDRLAAILREPGTKSTADLIVIEKELAQVQGDIEAATAQRDYLRTITETVRVDITYVGLSAQVATIDLSPINRAVRSVGDTFAQSVAALISFLATIIPWIPLLAFVAWGARRAFRWFRGAPRSTARRPEQSPESDQVV
jgi:hypothetical protein